MNILLNDQQQTISENTTLAEFIKPHANDGQAFAIAINDSFVPQPRYEDRVLQDGDRVELLIPMQGG